MADDDDAKEKSVTTRMDKGLYEQVVAYAREHKISVGALIRALLRFQTDPEDPRPPPPGADEGGARPPGPGRGHKKPRR
jgi:hypothetical protein